MNIEDVQKLLGEHAELFDYTVREGYVIAKPKNKIDSADFKAIGKLVRQENGEYVRYDYSTKTGGHFQFKMDVPTASPQNEAVRPISLLIGQIDEAMGLIQGAIDELKVHAKNEERS